MSKARKKHKYIARIPYKNNTYRYFYVQSEYEAYLAGVQKSKLSSDYKISDSEREDIKNTKKLEKQYGDQVYRSADEYEAQIVKDNTTKSVLAVLKKVASKFSKSGNPFRKP